MLWFVKNQSGFAEFRPSFVRNFRFVTRRKKVLLKYLSFFVLLGLLQFAIQAWKSRVIAQEFAVLSDKILDPRFAGAPVCGSFPCLGESSCFPYNQVTVNLSGEVSYSATGWLSVIGSTKKKNLVTKVSINVLLHPPCARKSCAVDLLQDVFIESNYKSAICMKLSGDDECDIEKTMKSWPRMQAIRKSKGRLKTSLLRNISRPFTCASPRLADRVLRRVYDTKNRGSVLLRDYDVKEKSKLMLLIQMSPGSVVQMLFPPTEGWIFLRTLGRCGNVVLHSLAIVQTLNEMFHEPWKRRLDIAIQLLDLAHHFSDNDSKYMILLHHLRAHDFGLSPSGKLRIKNADDVVIVDQHYVEQERFRGRGKTLEVPYDNKPVHFPDEALCHYSNSDANYYVMCRHILSGTWKGPDGETLKGGLLHSPKENGNFANEMFVLLDICIRGRQAVPDDRAELTSSIRRLAAGRLRQLLVTKRVCSAEFKYRYPECELMDRSKEVYNLPNFELNWIR